MGNEKTAFQLQLERVSGFSGNGSTEVANKEPEAQIEAKTPFQLQLESISKGTMKGKGISPVESDNPIAIANKINAEKVTSEPGFFDKVSKAWYNGWGTMGYSLGAGIEWAGFELEAKMLEEWGQSLKMTGVQAMNKNEVPHLKDFEWKDVLEEDFWAYKVPTILPSIITLAGISAVAGKPFAMLGSAIGGAMGGGTGVAAGAATGPGAVVPGAVGAAIGGAVGHVVGSALVSRTIEGLMEAGGAREQAIYDMMEKGVPEKEAKKAAGAAALEVFKKNYSLVGLDFTQFALAFLPKYLSGFKNLKSVPYKSLTKGQKFVRAIDNIPGSIRIPTTVVANMSTETFEEGYQQWIAEQAIRRAKGQPQLTFDEFIEKPETKEAMALGAVGGGGFAILGEAFGGLAIKTKKQLDKKNKEIVKKATRVNDNISKLSGAQTQKELESLSQLMQNEFIVDAVAGGRSEEVVKLLNNHIKDKETKSRALGFLKEVKDNFDSIPDGVKSSYKAEILRSIYSKKEAETLISIQKEEDSKKGIDKSITEAKAAPLKERIANEDKLIKAFVNPKLYEMLNDDLKAEFNKRTGKTKPTIPEGYRVVKQGEVLPEGYELLMNFDGTGVHITNAPEAKTKFTSKKSTILQDEAKGVGTESVIQGPGETEIVEVKEEYQGKVVYATPGAGKTTLVKKNPDKFIDGDSILMEEIKEIEVPGMKGTKAFTNVNEKNLANKLRDMWSVLGKEEAEALYDRALEKGKKLAKETGKTVLFGSQRLIPDVDFVMQHRDVKRLEERLGKGYKERIAREEAIIKESGKSIIDLGKGFIEEALVKKKEQPTTQSTFTKADIEAKKADIERRRQEELLGKSFTETTEKVVTGKGQSAGKTIVRFTESKISSDGEVSIIKPKVKFKNEDTSLSTTPETITVKEFREQFYENLSEQDKEMFDEFFTDDSTRIKLVEARIGLKGNAKGQVNIDVESLEGQPFGFELQNGKEINAKYDAELKALKEGKEDDIRYQKLTELTPEEDSILVEFSNDLSERFNIPVKIITEKEASKFKGYNGEPAFFDTDTKTAYLVKGKANKTSAIHEIFTHPFLLQIEKTNKELYNNLLREAKSNKSIVDYVNKEYAGADEKTLEHEYIARAIDLAAKNELDKTKDKDLISYVKEFFEKLTGYLKELFGLENVKSSEILPTTTIEELTQFVMYGKGKMNLNVKYEPSEHLTEKLQKFLESLNFTVEFKEDVSEEFDALAMTDLLYKTILIKNNYRDKGLVKETAYVAYKLLGTKNKLRTSLIYSIENIDNYQKIFDEYKKSSPNLNDAKIRELIVVDFLADAIYNNYLFPKDSYVNKKSSYWQLTGNKLQKTLQLQLSKLKQFIYKKIGKDKLTNEEITDLLDDIANDVLTSNLQKYDIKLSKEEQLLNYEQSVEKDKKAVDIIKNFQKIGLTLTGSLALRREGTIYRRSEDNLHDLDFSITFKPTDKSFILFMERMRKVIKIAQLQGQGISEKEFYKQFNKFFETHPVIKEIKKVYPEFVLTKSFSGDKSKRNVTIQGKIGDYMIDIFFVSTDFQNMNGFQDWKSIFIAKLKMGRYKDIKDFVNWKPYNIEKEEIGKTKGFRHFTFKDIKNDLRGSRGLLFQKTSSEEDASGIYNKLGNKTQSENVVIDEVKGRKPAVESKKSYKDWANDIIGRFSIFSNEILRKNQIEQLQETTNGLIEGLYKVASFAKEDLNNKQYEPFVEQLKQNGFKQVEGKEWLFTKDGVNPEQLYQEYLQSSKPIVAYRTRGNNFLEAFEKDNAIGNPWSHAGYSLYKTNTVKEAVEEFIAWMIGEKHTDKLQDYRQAIINKIPELKGKQILYYEDIKEPSHATALDYLINKYDWTKQSKQKESTIGKGVVEKSKDEKQEVEKQKEPVIDAEKSIKEEQTKKEKSFYQKIKERAKEKYQKIVAIFSEEEEEEIGNGGLFADGDERQDKNQLRIRHLYKDAGIDEKVSEELLYNITHLSDFNEKDVLGEIEKLKNGTWDERILGDHLSNFPVEDITSLLAAYKSYNNVPFITIFNRGGKDYGMFLANKRTDVSAETITTIEDKINNISKEEYSEKYKAYQEQRLKQRQKYNTLNGAFLSKKVIAGKPVTKEMVETQKLRILETDLQFLEDITGVDWKPFLEGYKDKFKNYEEYYLHHGTSKLGLSYNNPLTNFVIKDNIDGLKNNIIKGGQAKTLSAKIAKSGTLKYATRFDNVQNNQKSGFNMESNISMAIKRVLSVGGKHLQNKLVQFWKKENKPVELYFVEGVKNIDNNEGKEAGELSSDDMRLIHYLSFAKGEQFAGKDKYLHPIEQLSDKKPIVLVPVKKHTTTEAIAQYNDILKSEFGKYVPGQEEIGKWIKTILSKMESLQKNGKLKVEGELNEVARQFVYNYVVNKHYSDLYFFGTPESYLTKDKKDIDYVDMTKRGGSSISTGQAPLIGIDGGVQEEFGHVVINDLTETLKIGDYTFENEEITDGGGFISEQYGNEINKSHGSVFDYGQSIKGVYSDVNEENLKRDLIKGHHIVLTKEMANMYPALMPFYELLTNGKDGQRIDMISFKSTAKKVSGDISEAVWENGKLKEFKSVKINKLKSRNFLIQQDLREDSETKERSATRQMFRNFMQFANMDNIQSLINGASNNRYNKLVDRFESFNGNPNKYKDELLELIADTPQNKMIREYIEKGVSVNHPYLGSYVLKAMSSVIKRELLDIKVNGGRYTVLPPLATKLRSITKRKGKVEIKNGKHIFKETIHGSEITFPAECLVPQDSGLEIGEVVFMTRVPSSNLHSTTMFIVKGFLPKGVANTVMLDPISSKIAGEDKDGDQRYMWSKYKDLEGNFIESKNESKDNRELMNRAFDLAIEEYSNIENFEKIIVPIDTEAISEFLPAKEKRNPNKYNPESFIEMYENNKDGKKTIGIVARASAVYAYIRKAKEAFRDPIGFPRLKTGGKGVISNVSLESGVITSIANNVNQAVDAAKLQNLRKMGMTETHATMYNALIMFGENEADVIAFFNHPTVKEYRNNVEKLRSAISNQSENDAFYLMAEQIEGIPYSDDQSIYRKLKDIDVSIFEIKNPTNNEKLMQLKYLEGLQRKFKDIRTISDAINYTEKAPKGFAEYYKMIQTLKAVINNSLSVTKNSLQFVNEKLKNMPYFSPALNNRSASSVLMKDFSIFGTIYAKEIVTSFENIYFNIKNRKGENILSSKKVEELEKAIYRLLTEEAIAKNVNRENLIKSVNKQFNENIGSSNAFLDLLTIENGKLILKEQYRGANLSEYEDAIKKDFAKLPQEFKDNLVKYNVTEYNYSVSNRNGGFSRYFDTDTQVKVGEKIDKVIELWKKRKSVPEKVIIRLMEKNPELIPTVVLKEYKDETRKGRLRIVTKSGVYIHKTQYPPYVIHKSKAGKFVLKLVKTYTEKDGKKTLADIYYAVNDKAKRIKELKEIQSVLPEDEEYGYYGDDDIPEVHYQTKATKDEKLLSSDPELEAYMMSRLSEMFPDVKVFKDKKAFREYVEKHVGPGKTVKDFNALGAAFLDAMFIDETKAVQSTPFHELAHLYWDALPKNHPLRVKISNMFKSEEEAIQAIGEAVVNIAKREMKETKFSKLLREFWKTIKELFGSKSEEDYVEKMASKIWNNEDLLSAERMRSMVVKYQDDVVENMNMKETSEMESEIENELGKSIADLTEEELMYGISRELLDEEQRRNAGIADTWRDQMIFQIRNKPERKEPIIDKITDEQRKEAEELQHIQDIQKEIDEIQSIIDFTENLGYWKDEEDEASVRRQLHMAKTKKEEAIKSYFHENRKPVPKTLEEVITEVFPIEFNDYLQNRISDHSKMTIDEYYKNYLKEWEQVENIFWKKINSEEDLISKTKTRGTDSAYALHNRLSEMQTIASLDALTILSDRIMKSFVIEDMKSEVGSSNEDKKGTRMYYQMLKGGISDDWSGNSWISGKYSLISPTLVREPILQYRERIYQMAITEINAKQHTMRREFNAANKELRKHNVDFEKEMMHETLQKIHAIIPKNGRIYDKYKKDGSDKSKAIIRWIDLYDKYEREFSGVSLLGKTGNSGYKAPQVEMDVFEMIKDFGIDKTIEIKLFGENMYDEIVIDTSGLKTPGLGKKMTYGEAKKIIMTRGKGVVGKIKVLIPMKVLEKRAKKAVNDGIDAGGNILKMKDSKKIGLPVNFTKSKYATKNIPEVAIKYFDAAIFKKDIAPLLPILSGIKNFLSTGPNKKPNISNWLEMVEDNKIYGIKLESAFGPLIGSILQSFTNWTHWKYLGLNLPGQVFNAMAGLTANLVQVGPYRMIKGLYRLISGFGINSNFDQAFVHSTMINLMRDLDIVNTSVDAELSISQRSFAKFSNFVFSPITFVEYINHAYSFLGMMENNEVELILRLKKEGKSSHEIQKAVGYERILELKQITQRINGSYNPFAKRLLNATPEGRALAQFKNWMPDIFLAHFSPEYRDLSGKTQKGILRGVKDVGEDHGMSLLKKIFKANFSEFKAEWATIRESDKVALRKFGRELFVMGTLALIYASYDDDKKEEKRKLARMLGDVGFIYDLDNTAFFLDGPMPSLGTAADVLRLTKDLMQVSVGGGERYKRDTDFGKKGELKVPIQIINQLPANKLIKELYRDN